MVGGNERFPGSRNPSWERRGHTFFFAGDEMGSQTALHSEGTDAVEGQTPKGATFFGGKGWMAVKREGGLVGTLA